MRTAYFHILTADILWGFGFVASIWALNAFAPAEILFLRFLITIIFSIVIFRKRLFRHSNWSLLKQAFVPSFFLFGELFFQINGLPYTSASKAGFITTLFIFFVPALESLFFRKKIGLLHWCFVGLALMGSFFLTQPTASSADTLWGDVLILLSSLFASFHIISVEKISRVEKDLFGLNIFQCFWCLLWAIPQFIWVAQPASWLTGSAKSVSGLLFLSLGPTLVAFYFQLKAQNKLNPSVASLLFLLEAPLAAFFGFIFLSESLTTSQTAGTLLIISAAIGMILYNHFFQQKEI